MDDLRQCAYAECWRAAVRHDVYCEPHRKVIAKAERARKAAAAAAAVAAAQPDLFEPAPPLPKATSADAAARALRQRHVLTRLAVAGRQGLTWRELADWCDWHHGTASGALSSLHRQGSVVRLQDTRQGSAVYVLPHLVDGRAEAPRRATAGTRQAVEVLRNVDALLARNDVDTARAVLGTAIRTLAG
jgi:hypothetical protein